MFAIATRDEDHPEAIGRDLEHRGFRRKQCEINHDEWGWLVIKYRAKLGIYSETYSAEDISSILGIDYHECWVKGMQRTRLTEKLRFEEHAWFRVSTVSDQLPLEHHILELLTLVKPVLKELLLISDGSNIYFNCTIRGNQNPELYFSSKVLEMMAGVRASLDIDVSTRMEVQRQRRGDIPRGRPCKEA